MNAKLDRELLQSQWTKLIGLLHVLKLFCGVFKGFRSDGSTNNRVVQNPMDKRFLNRLKACWLHVLIIFNIFHVKLVRGRLCVAGKYETLFQLVI